VPLLLHRSDASLSGYSNDAVWASLVAQTPAEAKNK
jgi:hypothetical protein